MKALNSKSFPKKNSSTVDVISSSVGIIANVLTSEHRALVVEKIGNPNDDGCFDALKFTFTSQSGQIIAGEIILLDVLTDELSKAPGIRQGREYAQAAIKYFSSKGINVVALTSATKRLTGKQGELVKDAYPQITFTNGDNGTWISSLKLINRCLNLLTPEDKIVVMGSGLLGEPIIRHLIDKGQKKITVFSEQTLKLPEFVRVTSSFEKTDSDVKLLICCTHKYRNVLDASEFLNIFSDSGVIVDVAVPPGIGARLYGAVKTAKPGISRYDVGDYFLHGLAYNFDPALLWFPAVGYWYGCFTESIADKLAKNAGENLASFDFFLVNEASINLINRYLENERIEIPLINSLDPEQSITLLPY